MREIKFRAWYEGQMLGPTTMKELIEQSNWVPDDAVNMQYTGLKDRKGVEIYEGDVVVINKTPAKHTTVVDFHDGAFGLLENGKHYAQVAYAANPKNLAEVIGNIYENPKLLK